MDGESGPWPEEFPALGVNKVAEGLVVRSLSGEIQGRTTGNRQPCKSHHCPGWFIGVRWETGQLLFICSEGWAYDPATKQVRVTGGGEISARCVSPIPLGVAPVPREDWPSRERLADWAGWRSNEGEIA